MKELFKKFIATLPEEEREEMEIDYLNQDDIQDIIDNAYQLTAYEKYGDISDEDVVKYALDESKFNIENCSELDLFDLLLNYDVFVGDVGCLDDDIDELLSGLKPSEIINRNITFNINYSLDNYYTWDIYDTITGYETLKEIVDDEIGESELINHIIDNVYDKNDIIENFELTRLFALYLVHKQGY